MIFLTNRDLFDSYVPRTAARRSLVSVLSQSYLISNDCSFILFPHFTKLLIIYQVPSLLIFSRGPYVVFLVLGQDFMQRNFGK